MTFTHDPADEAEVFEIRDRMLRDAARLNEILDRKFALNSALGFFGELEAQTRFGLLEPPSPVMASCDAVRPDGVRVEVKTTQQKLVTFKYELEDDRQVLVIFADRYKPGTFEIWFNGPSSALLENVRRVHKHSGRRIFYHSDLKRIQELVKPEQILKEVKA